MVVGWDEQVDLVSAGLPHRITFIGLGAMGAPMAARLASDDRFEVTTYDVSRLACDAASRWSRTADDMTGAIDGAEVICSMVPADEHLANFVTEIAGSGRHGQLFIDFSTVSPTASVEAERDLAAAGLEVLSASCMKSVAAARSEELSLFVGGDSARLAGLAPVLDRLAATCVDTRSLRAAKALKIVNNLLMAANGFCYLDGLVTATRLGCTAPDAVEAIQVERTAGRCATKWFATLWLTISDPVSSASTTWPRTSRSHRSWRGTWASRRSSPAWFSPVTGD